MRIFNKNIATPHSHKIFQTGALKTNLIAIVLISIALVATALLLFPPTYKTNLSAIGQGKPAIVIVYDANDGNSFKLVENFNAIREKYEPRIEFFMADPNVPEGKKFEITYSANTSTALFFAAEGGKPVLVINSPLSPNELDKAIVSVFGQ